MKSLQQYINENSSKPLYLVELSNINGKKLSAKVIKKFKQICSDFNTTCNQLDKSYVNCEFDNEEMAKRCGTRLNADAFVDPIFSGCLTSTVQDQPRSERHYVIGFHRY